MRTLLSAVLVAVSLVFAPLAWSDPCQGVLRQDGCRPRPWDGQLMPTWNTPGYYGGWTNGPVMCDPHTLQCRGWAQP